MTEEKIDRIIREMVQRIVEGFHPELIVLFGSHARGDAGHDSDVDLLVAELLLSSEECCPACTICFHAQQCAEEYVKALLVYLSVPFPKVHDIGELLHLVPASIKVPLTA